MVLNTEKCNLNDRMDLIHGYTCIIMYVHREHENSNFVLILNVTLFKTVSAARVG